MTIEVQTDPAAVLTAARKRAGELTESSSAIATRISKLTEARRRCLLDAVTDPTAMNRAATLREEIATAEADLADAAVVADAAIEAVRAAEKAIAEAASAERRAAAEKIAHEILQHAETADAAAQTLIASLREMKAATRKLWGALPAAATVERTLSPRRVADVLAGQGLGETAEIPIMAGLPRASRPVGIIELASGALRAVGLPCTLD